MIEVVAEVLESNMPQSQEFFLALISLLDRLEFSPNANFSHLRTINIVVRILLKALDEPGFKNNPDFQLISLMKYPSVIRKLTPGKIQELPPEEVGTLTSKQLEIIFNTFVPITTKLSFYRQSAQIKKDAKKVFTLEQIQMLPPEEIKKYISRLPFAWISRLTPKQKQMIIQDGIDKLSSAEVRVLGGLGVFQKENITVRNGIQGLRPLLDTIEHFILDHLLLSDQPLTVKEISQRYSISIKESS